MDDWLSDGGTSDYPATWEGLVSILEAVQCSKVAEDLKHVLASIATPTSEEDPFAVKVWCYVYLFTLAADYLHIRF